MDNLLTPLVAGMIAIFSTIVGSFAGGATSLIMFPLILMFAVSNYMDAFTANKIGTLFMTLSAGFIHSKRGKINIRLFLALLIFGLIGTGIGTYIVQYQFNEELFKKILATCLVGIGIYLFFAKTQGVHSKEHRKIDGRALFWAALFSIIINILNGIFGGTGLFLTIFFVVYFKMTFIESMVYTMPVYAIVNIFQTSYLVYSTNIVANYPLLAITMALCGLLGGMIGTRLQYLKGNVWVKKVSILVMIVLGIKTFIG